MTDLPPEHLGPDDRPTEKTPSANADFAFSVSGYRILQLLATGGMGEVYEAEQIQPVRRRVALKVIKLGMDTREVVARFESERQALALMNHPNIAGVYDGGATDQGRPFFAMEFVPGDPITSYCDRHRLTTRQRLELFLEVCSGVQHAHQKGIIHRDLKPSNVLVTVQDERSVAKIIDFGVAKATSHSLTDKTVVTTLGSVIGTPEYMSPEQAENTGLDIDTRTDVYSLGMLLYELVAGALPFDSSSLRRAGFAELQRRIREEEPPKPSTRVTTLGEGGQNVATSRGIELPALARELRGDLDWIILKSLEKDRTRRYETVNALALDIRRHLDDEPVRASPPSPTYRAGKFVRRHRAAVISASVLALVLIAGVIGTTVGLVRAVRAERRASQEAETASQVSTFLVDLFRVADPEQAQGATITAREILDSGAERIRSELAGQPLTQARLMGTIGTVYRNLGLYDEALPLMRQSVTAREEHLDPNSPELAESLIDLGGLTRRAGEYEEAEVLTRRALTILEENLEPGDPAVAEALSSLGWALTRLERHEEAEPLFERALTVREAALGPDHPDVAESLSDLGIFRWRRGDFAAAEPLLQRALAIFERALGTDDYRIRSNLNNLAVLYWTQAKHPEAQALYERSLHIKERVLGPDHPEVATTLNNLALLFDAQELYSEAQPLLERSLAIFEASFGPHHEKTGLALGNLAWIHYRQGDYDVASTFYSRALSAYLKSVGPDHTSVAILLRDQARMHFDLEEWLRAEELLRRSTQIWKEAMGADHPEVAESLALLATVYAARGEIASAEALFKALLTIREARFGPDHPSVAETIEDYAALLRDSGREQEANALAARKRAGSS